MQLTVVTFDPYLHPDIDPRRLSDGKDYAVRLVTAEDDISISVCEGGEETYDMTFNYALNDVLKIDAMAEAAYRAGLAGEPLTLTRIEAEGSWAVDIELMKGRT